MEDRQVSVGDTVRHRKIMSMTDLYVYQVKGDRAKVRYANDGVFLSQEFFVAELEIFEPDEDEFD